MLGRLGIQQGDYVAASNALRRAVEADSGYWVSHHYLDDAYLKQRRAVHFLEGGVVVYFWKVEAPGRVELPTNG